MAEEKKAEETSLVPVKPTETPAPAEKSPEEEFFADDSDVDSELDLDLQEESSEPAVPEVEAVAKPEGETDDPAKPPSEAAVTPTPPTAPVEPSAPPAPEAAPAAPVVPPVAEPTQVQQQPPAEPRPEPVAPVAAPTEPIAPVAPTVPEVPVPTAAEMRTQAEETLATQHYALSEEQAAELNEDMAIAVPKMMARVYMDSVTNTLAHVLQNLPGLVDNVLSQRKVVEKDEESFFTSWPKLREHRESITNIAQVYRQLHPTASPEQFIRDVGAQTMVAMKLTVDEVPAETPEAPTRPFVPAASSPPASPGPPPTNPFEQMALEEEVLDMD
ncbi:hypothetical protein LCGC14_2490900 [marine sediment metagenome]|uniref:Uncharacterized protein n=1 Tax=marine sediment metagenome TaxID=412755 RepID=A0A0F9B4V4_9ZZZZ